jgi:hypothetical protein
VCACVRVDRFVLLYTVYECVRLCACVRVCVWLRVNVCAREDECSVARSPTPPCPQHTLTHTDTHGHTHTHIRTYTDTHTHTQTHTHTHTRTHRALFHSLTYHPARNTLTHTDTSRLVSLTHIHSLWNRPCVSSTQRREQRGIQSWAQTPALLRHWYCVLNERKRERCTAPDVSQ